MYWIPKTTTPPLNRQDVVVWCYHTPGEYRLAKYYDIGTEMDDGQTASLSGFYTKNKTGKRLLIRSGVSYYLPLEIPRPTEETRAKQYRRGYRAALLRVLAILEARSKRALAGEAWFIKDLHSQIEHETRRIMRDETKIEVEVREL